jgi:hypothetical protein
MQAYSGRLPAWGERPTKMNLVEENKNNGNNECNKCITISLTRENLETISMALRFTAACLDPESMHLLDEIANVLTIIDNKLEEIDK